MICTYYCDSWLAWLLLLDFFLRIACHAANEEVFFLWSPSSWIVFCCCNFFFTLQFEIAETRKWLNGCQPRLSEFCVSIAAINLMIFFFVENCGHFSHFFLFLSLSLSLSLLSKSQPWMIIITLHYYYCSCLKIKFYK